MIHLAFESNLDVVPDVARKAIKLLRQPVGRCTSPAAPVH